MSIREEKTGFDGVRPGHTYAAKLMVIFFVGTLGVARSASAVDRTWDGDTGSGYRTASNWTPSGAPTASDNVFFSTTFGTAGGTALSYGGGDANALGITIDTGTTFSLTGNAGNDLIVGSGGLSKTSASSGTQTFGGSGSIRLSASQTWAINGSGLVTITGSVSGAFNLTKTGTGTLRTSAGSTYSGTTTIAGGTWQADSIVVSSGASGLGNASSVVTLGSLATEGTLSYTGNSATYTRGFSIGGAGGGRFEVTTAGQTVTVSTGSIGGSGLFTIGGAGNTTITSAVGHTGGLTKVGSGTLTLNGAGTYSGTTTVNGGLLAAASGGLANTAAIAVNGATLSAVNYNAAASLTLDATATGTISGTGLSLGSVTNNNTSSSSLNFSGSSGTVTVTSLSGAGSTRFGSNATITGGVSSGSVTTVGLLNTSITGGVTNSGSLAAAAVSGGTNTVTGTASITTLSGGSTSIGGVATLTTMSSGTLALNGATASIATLNGGSVSLGTTALTVNGGTFAGVISGTGGSLVKTTSGTLVLDGNNTYKGTSTVSNGLLVVNGDQQAATGALSIAAGAGLSGSGTVGGVTAITGTHSPGNVIGLQTFNADLTYSAGSIVNWNLLASSTSTANTNQVGLASNANLTFSGSTALDLGFNSPGSSVDWSASFWSSNRSWLVYDLGTGGVTSGLTNFSVKLEDWLDSTSTPLSQVRPDASFQVTQIGQDVYLNFVAVPEPSTQALVFVGLACGSFGAWRRRRETR